MKNIFIAGILLLTSASYAQITISQEKNIADAMELKKEIARTESAFQVQIYNGNITEANKVMLDAKSKYKQYPVLLTFESPNYKVRLGSFHNIRFFGSSKAVTRERPALRTTLFGEFAYHSLRTYWYC